MGFLSSLLPTVVGLGVGAATGNPLLGAAAAGGLGYAQSGSLQQGLMAGLAGYGGAGLGEALAKQGMQEAAAQSMMQEATKNAALEGFTLPADYQSTLMRTVAAPAAPTGMAGLEAAAQGAQTLMQPGGLSQLGQNLGGTSGMLRTGLAAASPLAMQQQQAPVVTPDKSMGQRYTYSPNTTTPMPAPDVPGYDNLGQDFGRQQRYFTPSYTKVSDEQAKSIYGFAAGGGPVEAMSNANSIGQNTGFPQADIRQGAYATPWQTPVSRNMLEGAADTGVNPISGEMNFASGGLSDLGGYSDGGRLLRGPGDGVSDSIPAMIGKKQPARLADGEFVVPARIVSELGNGSTEAGARQLYAMMDRVQKARGKTVGKGKIAKRNNPQRMLPA